jgi:hypothetical protein
VAASAEADVEDTREGLAAEEEEEEEADADALAGALASTAEEAMSRWRLRSGVAARVLYGLNCVSDDTRPQPDTNQKVRVLIASAQQTHVCSVRKGRSGWSGVGWGGAEDALCSRSARCMPVRCA